MNDNLCMNDVYASMRIYCEFSQICANFCESGQFHALSARVNLHVANIHEFEQIKNVDLLSVL